MKPDVAVGGPGSGCNLVWHRIEGGQDQHQNYICLRPVDSTSYDASYIAAMHASQQG